MEIMQTIGTILFALSALGYLFLAVFDKPSLDRQRVHTSPEVEPAFDAAAQPRMLRAILGKLRSAGDRDVPEAERDGIRRSPELEKAA